jgi:hypothetical protein
MLGELLKLKEWIDTLVQVIIELSLAERKMGILRIIKDSRQTNRFPASVILKPSGNLKKC